MILHGVVSVISHGCSAIPLVNQIPMAHLVAHLRSTPGAALTSREAMTHVLHDHNVSMTISFSVLTPFPALHPSAQGPEGKDHHAPHIRQYTA